MATVRYDDVTYQTYGDLPVVGSHAPDINLVNTKLANVSLSNWTGMRKIMNIFVSIEREVCAKSVMTFDRMGDGQEDLAMLMVSYDLPFTHDRFGKEHGLTNVDGLSAIRHAGFGENYGVLITDGPLAGMFSRAVVVLDENNTVVHTEQLERLNNEPDYHAAFRALGIETE
jgi:thiol peroxidase